LNGDRNVAGVNAENALFKGCVDGVQRLRNEGIDFERWQPARAIGVEFVVGFCDFEPRIFRFAVVPQRDEPCRRRSVEIKEEVYR
jgi:hypothetical protein